MSKQTKKPHQNAPETNASFEGSDSQQTKPSGRKEAFEAIVKEIHERRQFAQKMIYTINRYYGDDIDLLEPLKDVQKSLNLGRAFLGKILKYAGSYAEHIGAKGTENPYLESRNTQSKNIEPLSDDSETWIEFPEGTTWITGVKLLRLNMEDLVDSVEKIFTSKELHSISDFSEIRYLFILSCMSSSFGHFQEADIHLGYTLGLIRDKGMEDKTIVY